MERVGSGMVVDLVASQGHCLNSRTTRQLRHTLAQSELSGEAQLVHTVREMRKNGRNPNVFFSVDNKDFTCPGTVDGESVHFITLQAYVIDATDGEGDDQPFKPICVPRLNTALKRKAPTPKDVEATHYPASKMVPPGLHRPCDSPTPASSEGRGAAEDGRAWAAASRFSHEEGGVDFKTFATRACKDHGGSRDLIIIPAVGKLFGCPGSITIVRSIVFPVYRINTVHNYFVLTVFRCFDYAFICCPVKTQSICFCCNRHNWIVYSYS